MNQTRYDNLCKQYGATVVDDYMQRVKDWAASKGKRIVDYAAAAANWMKKDDMPVDRFHALREQALREGPVCECGGEVREYTPGEAACRSCDNEWELKNGEWQKSGH